MAVKLNLLPPEYSVSTGLSKTLGITRMLGVISLALFLIFGLGLGAFFVVSTFELNNINQTNGGLKNQILAQASVENQVVLLKDRIKKIKTALSLASTSKNLGNVNDLIGSFGNGVSITELTMDPAKADLSVGFSNNADLSTFIKNVESSTVFKTITITSFGFNPSSGYLVAVDLLAK